MTPARHTRVSLTLALGLAVVATALFGAASPAKAAAAHAANDRNSSWVHNTL